MSNAGILLGIGVLGLVAVLFLRKSVGYTKYSIGEYIIYCGKEYKITNNRERDAQGRLLYQLQDTGTGIAYWFLVSNVDANICVM